MAFNDFIGDFTRSFLFALATLVPILNPPAAAPIFLMLTEGISNTVRAQIAKRVAVNILVMLAVAMVAGNLVLDFFGISLPIVRVGGGLLVIASAWRLVNASDLNVEHAQSMAESFTPDKIGAQAFYPLTFPMICGPGTLSAALTGGATLHDRSTASSLTKLAGTVPAIAVSALAVYFCLKFAARFMHKLGPSGTAVFMRLSAFILLCLGVQIVWDGAHDLLLHLLVQASALQAPAAH
jgi:multiple antibiotic resistance protein